MNLFKNIKHFAKKVVAVATVTAAVAGFGLSVNAPIASAASCDKVNIVYCGINGGSLASDIQNLRNKYNSGTDHGHTDLKAVYRWSGASDADIAGMNTSNTKLGTLYRNGQIKVGGEVIADHSWVSARFGAGQAGFTHIEGDVYARLTTTSFANPSVPVLVHFNANGTEDFSVMVDCGNAVKSTPKIPDYNIVKEVSVKGANSYHSDITVKPGTHVTYRITVSSTGSMAVKNVLVKDNLPSTAHYVDNTLARDGKTISDGTFFASGYTISSLDNGSKTVFTFEAIIGEHDTPSNCVEQTIDNVASISSKGLVTKKDNADVHKKCQPKPVYACKTLTATPGAVDQTTGAQTFTLKTTVTATNATVVSYAYDFGDSHTSTVPSTATENTVSHTYAPGDYTAKVNVTFKDVEGNTFTVTAATCAAPIHVSPVVTRLVCKSLTAVAGTVNADSSQIYTLNAAATLTNATVTSYVFNFGDNTASTTVTTGNATASTTHTYQPGTWTASVTVFGKDAAGHDVQSTNQNCQRPITVSPPQPKNPAIKIVKTVDGQKQEQVNVNQNFVYQLVITNTGEKDLVNAAVTDVTPEGVTLLSADLGTIANNNWSYTIPSLTVGQSVTVNITAKVATYVAGSLVNTACVNAPEVNPEHPSENDSCDTATVTVTPPTPQVLPTTLVNTGPGAVAGIFAGVTIVSAFAHRLFLSRKLAR